MINTNIPLDIMKEIRIWLPLYIGDFLKSTAHLTNEEIGGYVRLKMHYWCNGGPINNDKTELKNASKLTRKKLEKILKFFEAKDDKLIHDDWDKRISEAISTRIKNKNRTKKARQARHAKKEEHTSSVTEDVSDNVTPSTEPPATDIQSQSKTQDTYKTTIHKTNKIDLFEKFWNEYPEPKNKISSKNEYLKALEKTSPEIIMNGLKSYKRNKPDYQDWIYPTKWLQDERWSDVWEEPQQSNQQPIQTIDEINFLAGLTSSTPDQFKKLMIKKVGWPVFISWIKDLKLENNPTGKNFTLRAKNQFLANRINVEYMTKIQNTAKELDIHILNEVIY